MLHVRSECAKPRGIQVSSQCAAEDPQWIGRIYESEDPKFVYVPCKWYDAHLQSTQPMKHFISFQSLASVTHGHGTQALYWRCAKQKDRAKIFHCFKLENKTSSRPAPPTTAVASLYTLDPQEFFGRPRRKTRTASSHQWKAELQSFQEALTGDKSGCLKFLGGRFAPTQSCLRSCSQRSAGC